MSAASATHAAAEERGSFFERHGLAFTLAFAALLHVPWLGAEPVRGALEAFRLEASREMLRSGDWIVPTLNGEPYLNKPPLQYWLVSLASMPFGAVTVEIGRAVSALATIALAVLVFLFVRRELGRRQAVLAACALSAAGLIVEKSGRAELETLLALFTGAAILALFQAVWSGHRFGWILAGGLSFGAALLVKGPVPLLVVAIAIAGLVIGSPGQRKLVLACGGAILAIGVLAALPWLLALLARPHADKAVGTILSETLDRLAHAAQVNREPFWYYLKALPGGLAPASALLPGLFWLRAEKDAARQRSLLALSWAWSLGVMLVMSLSSAKEVRYLITTYPAWTMLMAWAWFGARAPAFDAYRRALILLAEVLTWIAPIAVAIAGFEMAPQQTAWIVTAAALLLAARIAATLGLRAQNSALVACAVLVGVFGVKVFLSKVRLAQAEVVDPYDRMGADVAARLEPGEPLAFVGAYDACVHWAIDHPLRVVASPSSLAGAHARLVLARIDKLPPDSVSALGRPLASWLLGSERWQLSEGPGPR